jgi:hypothetical protein
MEEELQIWKVEYLRTTEQIFLNFQLKLVDQAEEEEKWLKWRRPPLEEDLKILKEEYLSNRWTYLPKIVNLSLGDQTEIKIMVEMKKTSNGRRPQNIRISQQPLNRSS